MPPSPHVSQCPVPSPALAPSDHLALFCLFPRLWSPLPACIATPRQGIISQVLSLSFQKQDSKKHFLTVRVFLGSSFFKKKIHKSCPLAASSFPQRLLVIALLTSAAVPSFNLFLCDNYYFNSSCPIDIRICRFGLVEFLINVLVES